MKVLLINAVYNKLSTGQLVKELFTNLNDDGFQMFVAAADLDNLNCNCFKIGNAFDHKKHAFLSRVSGKQAFFSSKATKKLIEYITRIKPDVVHLNNVHSNYINIRLLFHYLGYQKIPVVITLHDSWFYTGKCNYYIQYSCDKWLQNCGHCPDLHHGNTSYFFDTSSAVLRDKEKLYSLISPLAVVGVSNWITSDAKRSIFKNNAIFECIYNWIDLKVFRPYPKKECCEIKKELNACGKHIVLGVSAIWSDQKGYNIFYKLADCLPKDFKIVLVGDFSLIKKKHRKINYLGRIFDQSLLARIYNAADIFLNPSIQETFGKTTAEALCCGLPVVAYNSTATPELVGEDGKCGILIEKFDYTLFESAILQVSQKGKDYYSTESRIRAEKLFSLEKNIKKYAELYKKINDLRD